MTRCGSGQKNHPVYTTPKLENGTGGISRFRFQTRLLSPLWGASKDGRLLLGLRIKGTTPSCLIMANGQIGELGSRILLHTGSWKLATRCGLALGKVASGIGSGARQLGSASLRPQSPCSFLVQPTWTRPLLFVAWRGIVVRCGSLNGVAKRRRCRAARLLISRPATAPRIALTQAVCGTFL